MEMNFCRRCGTPLAHIEKHIYKCEQGHPIYANASPSVGIFFITEKNEILLSVRGGEPRKGMLDAFGGFVDGAETLEHAIARELEEELHLKPDDYTTPVYLLSDVGNYPYQGEVLSILSILFWSRLHVDSSRLSPHDDVADIAIYPLADIPLDQLHNQDIVTGIKASQAKLL